jgi:hypothetical protein
MDVDTIIRLAAFLLALAPAVGAAQKFATDPLGFSAKQTKHEVY